MQIYRVIPITKRGNCDCQFEYKCYTWRNTLEVVLQYAPIFYMNILKCVSLLLQIGLSDASKKTLVHQGGKMSSAEAERFESSAAFDVIIKMRSWDEMAKDPHAKYEPLTTYKTLCAEVLNGCPSWWSPFHYGCVWKRHCECVVLLFCGYTNCDGDTVSTITIIQNKSSRPGLQDTFSQIIPLLIVFNKKYKNKLRSFHDTIILYTFIYFTQAFI